MKRIVHLFCYSFLVLVSLTSLAFGKYMGSSEANKFISHHVSGDDDDDYPDLRIIGGTDAIPGELPWQVSLQYIFWRDYSNILFPSSSHYCGGTIVDETHIVTAAHCIIYPLDKIYIIAGAHNVKNKRESTQQRSYLKRKIPHPKYNNKTIANDIAVITLLEPLNFTERVQPMRLAPKGHEPSGSCLAAGWGKYNNSFNRTPDVFQRITLKIVPRVPCKKKLPGLLPSMICAGASGYEQGTCNGDSGGPLICYDLIDNLPYLAGAVSWGRSGACGQVGYPTAFANIANLRQFLDSEIAIP